jgi:hypothetical protein
MSWKHISGWVQVTQPEGPEGPVDPGYGAGGPVDPGYGRPGWSPVDPGYGRPGWSPVDPGYGRPDLGPGHPDNSLPGSGGYIWGALIRWAMRPQVGGGPSKPPGRPVLPPHPSNGLPPNGGNPPHPWLPGFWEPVDPGFGKPPLWGWVPGVDNGLPVPPTYPSTGPLPPGQWVPTDPDYGVPDRCPGGGKPHPPIWAWIPTPPDLSKPVEPTEGASVTLYPTSGNAPAAGGGGSINVTLVTPGTWQVTGAPDWLTVTPTGPQTEDVQIIYTAAANTTGAARTATLMVNDATFTLNQAAA